MPAHGADGKRIAAFLVNHCLDALKLFRLAPKTKVAFALGAFFKFCQACKILAGHHDGKRLAIFVHDLHHPFGLLRADDQQDRLHNEVADLYAAAFGAAAGKVAVVLAVDTELNNIALLFVVQVALVRFLQALIPLAFYGIGQDGLHRAHAVFGSQFPDVLIPKRVAFYQRK